MQFGMIDWYVPLSIYPADYGENPKVPLSFVALGSQKSCMVLHFLCFYGHPTLSTWFTSEYRKSGKKLDMGKGCVRFKSLDDLALDVVGSPCFARGKCARQPDELCDPVHRGDQSIVCSDPCWKRNSQLGRPVI